MLDFVAQVNKKYDFAGKFRALTLRPEKNIVQQIENGFTLLPTGCSIIMEKKARQYILENIQQAIYNKNRLKKEINTYTTLPTILSFWKTTDKIFVSCMPVIFAGLLSSDLPDVFPIPTMRLPDVWKKAWVTWYIITRFRSFVS